MTSEPIHATNEGSHLRLSLTATKIPMCTKQRLSLKDLSLTATKIGRHGYSLYIDTHVWSFCESMCRGQKSICVFFSLFFFARQQLRGDSGAQLPIPLITTTYAVAPIMFRICIKALMIIKIKNIYFAYMTCLLTQNTCLIRRLQQTNLIRELYV